MDQYDNIHESTLETASLRVNMEESGGDGQPPRLL